MHAVWDAFQFISDIQALKDKNTIWSAFLNFAGQFGFTHGGLADMPAPGEQLQNTILCLSWPTEWSERYFKGNYIANDPARLHLARSAAPYTWGEMVAFRSYSKMQKTIVHEASEFRMKTGIVFPMLGPKSGPAMVTIAGENEDLSCRDKAALHMAAIYTHILVRKLSDIPPKPAVQALSERERECLQWNAVGKSDWEIGTILSISEKSASTYMQRVKHKFGVATRKQAVVEALRAGVINY
jgi:LuxR family quorum sensing-dependent transcriptional regulator